MKNILIIEDEQALQDALKQLFENDGYKVLQAYDGDEGLKLSQTGSPDIILLDLVLPKMHGFDALKAMKESDPPVTAPVLVLTNLEESDDVVKAIELGARGYLVKANYALKEVLAKVKEIIG